MRPDEPSWRWQHFGDLLPWRLYQIVRLRQEVFVVEQRCCYEDIDGWDQSAVHLLGCDSDGQLVAYSRVFAPGTRFPEASIGRVLTAHSVRGRGIGHALMRQAVSYCNDHFPAATVRIGAQAHLQQFYGAHGFVTRSPEYPVDGIPHVDMFRGDS